MDDIVMLSMVHRPPAAPPKELKCYKCQAIKRLNPANYAASPRPDKTNHGYAWACRSCREEYELEVTI